MTKFSKNFLLAFVALLAWATLSSEAQENVELDDANNTNKLQAKRGLSYWSTCSESCMTDEDCSGDCPVCKTDSWSDHGTCCAAAEKSAWSSGGNSSGWGGSTSKGKYGAKDSKYKYGGKSGKGGKYKYKGSSGGKYKGGKYKYGGKSGKGGKYKSGGGWGEVKSSKGKGGAKDGSMSHSYHY